jgi:putative chitinase
MDLSKLKGSIPDVVLAEIPSVMTKYSINTPLRLSHFLSQDAHESNNFKVKVENLNYGVEGLLKVFPKYFKGADAARYQRNPVAIANRVYANRMGNGDEASGDGWKHRGFGYIQLTGKNNQTAFLKDIGLDINTPPQIIADKYPLLSAGWFWNSVNLNKIADKGKESNNVAEVTRIVNGGHHGLPQRIELFNKFYSLFE